MRKMLKFNNEFILHFVEFKRLHFEETSEVNIGPSSVPVHHLLRLSLTLLVRLLDDGVLELAVHPLVLVHRVDLDHRTPIGRSLLNLRRIGAAVLKDRLVVVHVGDEDDDDGGGGVDGLGVGGLAVLHAALAVVHGGDVELVLVALQVDVGADQPDHARVRLDPAHSPQYVTMKKYSQK